MIQDDSKRPFNRIASRNILMRHGGQRAHRSRDQKLSWISIYICIMYLISHIWKFIPNCYDAVYGFGEDGLAKTPTWPKWLHLIKDLSHIMVVCNSAFNFLPYLWIKSNQKYNLAVYRTQSEFFHVICNEEIEFQRFYQKLDQSITL